MTTIPETFLKSYCPETFDGRFRDARAEDWLTRFERYCATARIAETGQERILCAGLLLTGNASRWYDQLGMIIGTTIRGKALTPYEVFKYQFRQRFINSNEAEEAFDRIRELRQKRSVNEYLTEFERIRGHMTDFNDKDAVRFFRSGLKPEIRQLVDNHPEIADDDINGLIALAERLDKMNKNERLNHNYRRYPPNRPAHEHRESYPQPMEIDAIRAHPNAQSRFQKPPKRDQVQQKDIDNNGCFYCHKTGHRINDRPERKQASNSKAH
ncbi:hypothetical protein BGZ83_003454 [Gryganskiella cystojenkinii]|nr:hypothetical protein BGZ83_003454 [Gryganskiella cystojenkinii]